MLIKFQKLSILEIIYQELFIFYKKNKHLFFIIHLKIIKLKKKLIQTFH